MKRILKSETEVVIFEWNVRSKFCTISHYFNDTNYCKSIRVLLNDDEIVCLDSDSDDDVSRYVLAYNRPVHFYYRRRNPFFSSKTGKPLSAWFKL